MVQILTPREKVYLETEKGREDIESSDQQYVFYSRVWKKGLDCIEDLTFLADYLPERYQDKLFTSENLMPLFNAILSVGYEVIIEKDKYVDIKGMPLRKESKSIKLLKLDKDGMKIWETRKKRIRNILSELLIMLDKIKPEELAREANQILIDIESVIGRLRGLQAIRLQEDIEKILSSRK